MKLRNKQTGEIIELCGEWENYEDPKEYWYIHDDGSGVGVSPLNISSLALRCAARAAIGNYFETKEEAELAVRKLKAWKRLKDKGFRFTGVYDDYTIEFTAPKEEIGWYWCNGMGEDLDLLFGGKE